MTTRAPLRASPPTDVPTDAFSTRTRKNRDRPPNRRRETIRQLRSADAKLTIAAPTIRNAAYRIISIRNVSFRPFDTPRLVSPRGLLGAYQCVSFRLARRLPACFLLRRNTQAECYTLVITYPTPRARRRPCSPSHRRPEGLLGTYQCVSLSAFGRGEITVEKGVPPP